jgi:hypothetical protein
LCPLEVDHVSCEWLTPIFHIFPMIDLLQTLSDLGCHFVVPVHPDRAYPAEGCAWMIVKVGLTSFLDLGRGICNVTFNSAGLNGFAHKCVPHTQVNNIHGKEKEHFIK